MTMIQRVAIVAAAAGLSLSLGGCVLATKEQVTTIPVAHRAGSAINVSAHNGHISVKAGGSDVQIVARLRMISDERLAATAIAANRDSAGVLVIAAMPPNGRWMSNEGCGFDITLPGASGVTLKSNNGRIEIAGLSGAADLKTSNGAITVAAHDGPVKADTSNGRISVNGATREVECDTSNGSVKVAMAPTGTGPVKIDTSNGSISLVLGKAFSGAISARTSNGSVSAPEKMPGGASFAFERSGRNRAMMKVGSGGAESELGTSNGGISISYGE
jgi:hypothetical protein